VFFRGILAILVSILRYVVFSRLYRSSGG